jgi:hypothetical protein
MEGMNIYKNLNHQTWMQYKSSTSTTPAVLSIYFHSITRVYFNCYSGNYTTPPPPPKGYEI